MAFCHIMNFSGELKTIKDLIMYPTSPPMSIGHACWVIFSKYEEEFALFHSHCPFQLMVHISKEVG